MSTYDILPAAAAALTTTSSERAQRGQASLEALVTVTGDSQGIDLDPGADPGGAANVLTEVLANLRHYADRSGIDFHAADDRAAEYFRAEKREETAS